MDGTLLTSNKCISDNTKKGLIEFQKNGGVMILSSGRIYLDLIEYYKELEMDKYGGYLVCLNGAEIYNPTKNYEFKMPTIPHETISSIVNLLKKIPVVISFYNADTFFVLKDKFPFNILNPIKFVYTHAINVFKLKDIKDRAKAVYNIDEMSNIKLYKFLITGRRVNLRAIKKLISEKYNGEFNVWFVGKNYLEITPIHTSKGNAIRKISEMENTPLDNFMCFGDSDNDHEMLNVVVHSFAMDNADDNTKSYAKNVCPSNDDDGIYKTLIDYNLI